MGIEDWEKWVSCGELLGRELLASDLFRYFKDGDLNPRCLVTGSRIVDLDPIAQEQRLRMKTTRIRHMHGPDSKVTYPAAPQPPAGCRAVSFTLSSDEKKARKQVSEAREWLVERQEVIQIKKREAQSGNTKEHAQSPSNTKLRHNQNCKLECRKIAKRIWEERPELTIREMTETPEISEHSKKKNGMYYTSETVRGWINDLCPNRKPGRRSR